MVNACSRLDLQPAGGVDAHPRHDGGQPGGGTRGNSGFAARGETAAMPGPAREGEFACMFGIPESELTPRVRDALVRLLAKFDEAKREVDAGHSRETYLQGLVDGDVILPIGNRRYLIRELSRIIARSRIAQTTSSFVMLSVTNGAGTRAVHGEAGAQALLCHAASTLVSGVRASDVVASLGGYDFGVVLTLAGSEAAAAKAQDLAERLNACPLDHEGHVLRAEVAWGIHEIADDDAADAAIAAADRDLLKRASRAMRAHA